MAMSIALYECVFNDNKVSDIERDEKITSKLLRCREQTTLP